MERKSVKRGAWPVERKKKLKERKMKLTTWPGTCKSKRERVPVEGSSTILAGLSGTLEGAGKPFCIRLLAFANGNAAV